MNKVFICWLAIFTFIFGALAETVSNNLDVQGGFIYNHGAINPADNGLTFTNAGVRDVTISAGQLSGVDPESGAVITNSANLLPLKVQSLDVVGAAQFATNVVISGGLDISGELTSGGFSGDGSGLTNLNAVTTEMDPVWSSEKAGYLTVSNAQQVYVSQTGGVVTVDYLTVRSNLVVGTGNASGQYALAEGGNTSAEGYAAHAEGQYTVAGGQGSHAEGGDTEALGMFSHAEGLSTVASGQGAHAEGVSSVAAQGSHAEGVGTRASYSGAHAEGIETIASGDGSHAEGSSTLASGGAAHAQGVETIASGEISFAGGYGAVASNDFSYVWSGTWDGISSTADSQYTVYAENGIRLLGGPIEGDGSGLTNLNAVTAETDPVWSSEKADYLTVSNAQQIYVSQTGGVVTVDHLTVRSNLVVGTGNASGQYALAEGGNTSAEGYAAHAEGQETVAGGQGSHAEGGATDALGMFSHAEGLSTVASGEGAHAEGVSSVAEHQASHAEGYGTRASHAGHAEGQETVASGYGSHAEGSSTLASGGSAHAQGVETIASGEVSFAGGYGAVASNDLSYVWSGTWDGISSTADFQYTVYAENGIRLLGGPIEGNGSGLTNFNLSAYAGDNLTWTNGVLNARTGYTDSNTIAAVSTQWPNLDTDSADDFDGLFNSLTDVPVGLADGDDVGLVSESDPLFSNSVAFGITTNDVASWNSGSSDTLLLDGTRPMQADLNMGNKRLVNVDWYIPPQGGLSMGSYTNELAQ